LLEKLIERGLNPEQVQLVVSDGSAVLVPALANSLPQTQQQRCITHKVRRIVDYLHYQQLPSHDEQGQPLSSSEARQQRRRAIETDAYEIYKAPSWFEAQERLVAFVNRWQPLEPKAVQTFLYEIHLTFTFYDFDPALYPRVNASKP
jgi:transposase-like protein